MSNGSVSDEEKVSLVLDLLLGGYETTSLLMSFTVYFLGTSPLALQQLKVQGSTNIILYGETKLK